MKAWVCFFCVMGSWLFGEPVRFEIQEQQLVYYVDSPEGESAYPIVVLIEGSYVDTVGPQSVLRLHKKIAQSFLGAGMGVVLMERRGADGERVDEKLFHRFNTPSQRLADHLTLVDHLKRNPPAQWNGQLIVLGGSEGGPIAVKLAHKVQVVACVTVVGCGSLSFKEYIWDVIQTTQASASGWKRFVMNWWHDLPLSRGAYEKRCKRMIANPTPKNMWFGQTFLWWADALEQTEAGEFLELKCPVFVVAGSQDIECSSTDKLVEMAKEKNQDVVYMRVEGMGHDALDPQWNVIDNIIKSLRGKVLISIN